MRSWDWLVVGLYLLGSLALGLWLSRKARGSVLDFFVSGRSLPWWLAGTSMAATTFSIDTPLYVAGVVGNRGIAGNWEWWSFAVSHMVLIYGFSRLWRRAEIITDAELTELRYGGTLAQILRGVKAFLFAVPINCIGIGYAMLAMVKVMDALALGGNNKLLAVIGISILVMVYCSFGGLWGVVLTDFFQFGLALAGAITVAVLVISQLGGLPALLAQVQAISDRDVLAMVPIDASGWSEQAGISISTFLAYVTVQWWAFRRSDGGGEFIQRLAATRSETEAEQASWLFAILHYVVRTWPWILVALAGLVVYPDLVDKELAYPLLMLDYLPVGILGLVVASLLAAFMSTVSTSINWGASYLTHDLYGRFVRPQATQAELVWLGQAASLGITILGAVAAFFANDIATVFRLMIAIGTGPGLILILRWLWWRVNAASELAAMLTGFGVGVITSIPGIGWLPRDFGLRLLLIAGTTALVCLITMALTPPESEATLMTFYRRVRPPGWGWRQQQQATGLSPSLPLGTVIAQVIAGLALLLGMMFAVGNYLLLNVLWGNAMLALAVVGALGLRWLERRSRVA